MAVYTTLSTEEITRFLSNYDIGQLTRMQGIAEGIDNTNYKVETVQDGQPAKYILTVFENRLPADELPFFMELTEWLHGRGIPCPRPVKDKKDRAVGKIAGKPASLVVFMEGKNNPEMNPLQVEQVGNLMARMHEATAHFPLTRHNTLGLDQLQGIFSRFRHRANEIYPNLETEMEQEFTYLRFHWPHGLPTGIIHGDLFPDNVFFTEKTPGKPVLSGVIDFYFACSDFLIYDLAICMNAWCFDAAGERFMSFRAKKLLEAYGKVRSITGAEQKAMPVLARAAAMRFLVTRANAWFNRSENALVTPKDPMEYVEKLRFHRQIRGFWQYGS